MTGIVKIFCIGVAYIILSGLLLVCLGYLSRMFNAKR
jgi:hypothetical protein